MFNQSTSIFFKFFFSAGHGGGGRVVGVLSPRAPDKTKTNLCIMAGAAVTHTRAYAVVFPDV